MTEYAAEWRFHLLEFAIRRLLKTASHEAAGELKPEAYPQGYGKNFDEPRTPLVAVFSIYLRKDVQNGRPAKPQEAGRMRRTLAVRRRETSDRERREMAFSSSVLLNAVGDHP